MSLFVNHSFSLVNGYIYLSFCNRTQGDAASSGFTWDALLDLDFAALFIGELCR